jgi:murein DD-endopeptidase MepM/ murein hydrolase activator NlpD
MASALSWLRNPYVWGLVALLVLAGIVTLILKKKITFSLPGAGTLPGGAKMLHPVPGSRVSSVYGMRRHPVTGEHKLHNGVDYAAAIGTMVVSPAAGVVDNVYFNATGGNQVTIKHDNGYTTGYAHLSLVLVDKGERVAAGEPIAKVGATGAVTGPHLHFTLRKTGSISTIDPQPLLT